MNAIGRFVSGASQSGGEAEALRGGAGEQHQAEAGQGEAGQGEAGGDAHGEARRAHQVSVRYYFR